jgi:hypothetical protein
MDFENQRFGPVPFDDHATVDRRQRGAVEQHVHDGAADR